MNDANGNGIPDEEEWFSSVVTEQPLNTNV